MAMEFTGERMVPEATDQNTYWEHVFRYAFACQKVKGLSVLDIACGEGYGTYALSKVAKSVIGVDICSETVGHARKKYGLDFRIGRAEHIPVETASLDAVVSFETLEHVPEPEKFVEETFRVLKPAGIFLISTPNKNVYLKGQAPNPFHCSELTKSEFESLLSRCFEIQSIMGQLFPFCALDDFQRIVGMLSNRLGFHLRRGIEKALRARYLPSGNPGDVAQRQRVIESIPTLKPPFNGLWNSFAIRQLIHSPGNEPTFFVALATKRCST